MKNLANAVTDLRIVFCTALLFFPALSVQFYVLYIAAGVTDMIDGTIARKTGSVTEFGSKQDTAADFIMVAACLFKLVPVIDLEIWMYVWIGIIAFIKAVNVVSGYVINREFVAVHSVLNKITGTMLFILPLTLEVIDPRISIAAVCTAATLAAVQEGHLIRTGGSASAVESSL